MPFPNLSYNELTNMYTALPDGLNIIFPLLCVRKLKYTWVYLSKFMHSTKDRAKICVDPECMFSLLLTYTRNTPRPELGTRPGHIVSYYCEREKTSLGTVLMTCFGHNRYHPYGTWHHTHLHPI